MTVALWLCSLPLIGEFAFAPFNLWSGRTLPNFVRFTGLPPAVAHRVFAPAKLLACGLLVAGLDVRAASMAGGLLTGLISVAYLLRLAAPNRRHVDGIAAFSLTFALSVAVFVLDVVR